ncbi:LRP1 [Mytilus coruscus]|uniref:LRP1 n=1 Tax=Mytilus coruscus TaxID=42192 RepID=A0A6J8B1A8_MYTCO|nr:LRP1 [Mytilus coruscus]
MIPFINFTGSIGLEIQVQEISLSSHNRILQTVVQTATFPKGIAVDSANDHIYWVDDFRYKLSRCNLDGPNMTVISTLIYPWVIRLDVTSRWMYISESYSGISKSRFNLAEKQTIVNFTSTPVLCMDIATSSEEKSMKLLKTCRDNDKDRNPVDDTGTRKLDSPECFNHEV